MNVAVIGGGSLGSLLAGLMTRSGAEVVLICRPPQIESLRQQGLRIALPSEEYHARVNVQPRLQHAPDLAVFATHLNDLEQAYQDNHQYLETCFMLTVQSGIQGANILSCHFEPEKIIDGAVLFDNPVCPPGPLAVPPAAAMVIGKPFYPNDRRVFEVAELVRPFVNVQVTSEIRATKWLKLLYDYIYCLPALTGQTLHDVYADEPMCRVFHVLLNEAMKMVEVAGIELASYPGFDVQDLHRAARTPPQGLRKAVGEIFLRHQDPSARGFLYRQLAGRRPSEVDFINGEIVQVASSLRMTVALNQLFVQRLHQVEADACFLTGQEVVDLFRPLVVF